MQIQKLKTVDADTLLSTPIRKTLFVVDGLIPQGLSVLSGPNKIGKSWLMLWLALQVSRGEPVWEFPSHRCGVLYLCLEDTFARIQNRLYLLTDEAPPELRIATMSFQIGSGLEQQIEQFLTDYPTTRLVIVDTFQKVRDSRSASGKSGIYANDYDDIAAMKSIADRFGIALILVHHTRKQEDKNDPFNQVSGSTGITGAADTSFVLKRSRTSELGTLLATGRDIEYQELTLQFIKDRHVWELVERKDMEDIRREEIPPFLFRVVEFMQNKAEWIGTATELLNLMQEKDTPSNTVTKLLGRFAGDVLTPAGIEYQTKRTGQSRLIRFQNMTVMTPVTAETTDMQAAVTSVTIVTNPKNYLRKGE